MAECAICMEKTSNFTTECNHSFCCGCASEWLLSNNSCPMCRKEFYHISDEELEEMELINHQNEITASPIIRYYPGITEIYTVFYLDSGVFYEKIVIYSIQLYSVVELKLPKNINMRHRKKKNYRFDNTNFNHVETRY